MVNISVGVKLNSLENLMTVIKVLKELGNDLKSVRQVKGMSLSAVARPAKISAPYLQKLEEGVVKNPSPRILHRLAGVLNISYVKLMELAGYFMPEETGVEPRRNLVEQALLDEELSSEERRAVAAFIAYLKDQRR